MAERDSILDAYKAPQPEEKKAGQGRTVKIGIIGTGWIAQAHVESYKKFDDVEIVALADLVPGKAEQFAEEYGLENVRFYDSHTALIAGEKDLDAVSVCTYNAQHAVCTIDALNAGLNVLLEKPLCVTLEEAIGIRRAEKASGKVLSIGFQPRYDANMKMVKKVVQSGVLGDVYYVQTGGGRRRGIPTPYGTTFIEKETGGIGALGDLGCYSLDMVLNALGYPKPLTVTGFKSDFFGKNPEYFEAEGKPAEYAEKFGVDDFAAAFVRLDNGTILDFRISWAMHLDTTGDTIFMGTKGSLRVPSTEGWSGGLDKPMIVYSEIAGEGVQTEIPQVNDTGSLFDRKIRAFVDAVQTGGEPPIPASEIIYNQAIIDGIAKSSDAGREIEIVIPEI